MSVDVVYFSRNKDSACRCTAVVMFILHGVCALCLHYFRYSYNSSGLNVNNLTPIDLDLKRISASSLRFAVQTLKLLIHPQSH